MNAACALAAALGPDSFLSNDKVCHCFLMDRNIIRLVVLSDKDSTSLYKSAEHRWSFSIQQKWLLFGVNKVPHQVFFFFFFNLLNFLELFAVI